MPFTSYGLRELVLGTVSYAFMLAACCFFAFSRHNPALMWLAVVPTVPFAWLLWFFRDPRREIPGEKGVVVSPADGVVTHIDVVDEPDFIGGKAMRCSIFLSIFSVHLNRAPLAGRVEYVKFRPGAFFDARREESLTKNQNQDMGLAVDEDGMPPRILIRQSTGAIARRIVCPVKEGDPLERGQRYGMIKFGSRTTLFVPADSGVEWRVKPGDQVYAGATVVAAKRQPVR